MRVRKIIGLVIFTALLAIILCLPEERAHATEGGSCGTNVSWSISDKGVLEISGTGAMRTYTSASGVPWYSSRTKVKTILVKDGVTSISPFAFANCSNCTSVTIPDSVTSVGRSAFLNCTSLSSIVLPDGVTALESNLFKGCTGLTGFAVTHGTPEIGDGVFSGCTALESVQIPCTVETIGEGAFRNCTALTDVNFPGILSEWENISIESGNECLTAAALHTMTGSGTCGERMEWNLAGDVLTISGKGKMRDYEINSLAPPWYAGRTEIREVYIKNGPEYIGEEAFSNCTALVRVRMPSHEINIGDFAFRNCTKLYSFSTTEGSTTIGTGAFTGCSSLKYFYVTGDIKAIESGAFYNCTALTAVGYSGTKSEWNAISTGNRNEALTGATISYQTVGGPCGDSASWAYDLKQKQFAIIGTGEMWDVKSDFPYWKDYKSQIKTATVRSGVTRIGSSTFDGFTAMTSVTIPSSVKKIGARAFMGCTKLASVTLPDKVTTISVSAFSGCTALAAVTLPAKLKQIASEAFKDCSALTSLTIPATLEYVYQNAFQNCTGLSSVTYEGDWRTWSRITMEQGNDCLIKATLHAKPGITSQPKSLSITEHENALFTVKTYGTVTGFQWYVSKDSGSTWTAISTNSGRSMTLSFTAALSDDGNQYYCVVTNDDGSTQTNTVTLSVAQETKPVVVTQPESQTVAVGETATLAVKATGGSLRYQWQYTADGGITWKDVAADSGKTATYTLTAAARHDGYRYLCMITNPKGNAFSYTVTLSVRPGITTQPTDASVAVGKTASFTVKADGAASYQWYFSADGGATWAAVSAASGKTATYSLKTAARHNGYQYKCVLKSKMTESETTTNVVTLKVKPRVTTQPSDVTVAAGKKAAFKITAENATTYQWYYRTSSTGTWKKVSASSGKTATYSLTAELRHNDYQYRCKVMNDTSYVYTKIVTLTVN